MTDAQKFMEQLRGLRLIAINNCYGGFGLSPRALQKYKDLAGIAKPDFCDRDIPRDDPYLIKVIKDLGMSANGGNANIKIVEVPEDVDWEIADYDGVEWVAEKHRTWT
jgi:hypothetical protein